MFGVCLSAAPNADSPAPAPKSRSNPDADATILHSNSAVNTGSFDFNFDTSNGINTQAHGKLKEISKNESAIVSEGGYAYKSANGEDISLTYTADEFGYHPQGAAIPTSPPIPAAIGIYIFFFLILS